MCSEKSFLLLLVFVICGGESNEECYKSDTTVPEFALGPTALFPWLGLLRVQLLEIADTVTAVTGVVLIKDHYAIAIASDVIKIPKTSLLERSKVMFIVEPGMAWYCKVKDYVVHPDQQIKISTIALLELETLDNEPFKVKPICWPEQRTEFKEYYSLEYVDDAGYLEKNIQKMQYIDEKLCEQFYRRANLLDYVYAEPARALCAYAKNDESFCLVDNGNVLASNDTGYWVIIGLSVHGPGCTSPARFINLQSYFRWLQQTMMDDVDGRSARRSAFGTGFRRPKKPFIEEQLHNNLQETMFPLHKEGLRTYKGPGTVNEYAFGKPEHKDMLAEAYNDTYMFTVAQPKQNELKLKVFSSQAEADKFLETNETCRQQDKLQYKEQIDFFAYDEWHAANYWITIADMYIAEYTCILMKMRSESTVKLNFVSYTYQALTPDLNELTTDPRIVLKRKKIKNVFAKKKPKKYPDKDQDVPAYLEEIPSLYYVYNLNVLVNFTFKEKAVLEVSIFGDLSDKPRGTFVNNSRREMDMKNDLVYVPEDNKPNDVSKFFFLPDEHEILEETDNFQDSNRINLLYDYGYNCCSNMVFESSLFIILVVLFRVLY